MQRNRSHRKRWPTAIYNLEKSEHKPQHFLQVLMSDTTLTLVLNEKKETFIEYS